MVLLLLLIKKKNKKMKDTLKVEGLQFRFFFSLL